MTKFTVLLSCMYEKNMEIIKRSNINFPAVIVNQCDKKCTTNSGDILWIDSIERGLSRSRNMAIKNTDADICLIADNDEIFDDDCREKILESYRNIPDADIIIFNLHNKTTKLKNKIYKLQRLEMLRVCSLQITFKRSAIVDNNISFDIKLGAGTGNGAGEENKFLLDCYDKGLKIYHYPINIATMVDNTSTWFNGFTEEFFYKHGMVTRYSLGLFISLLYAFYYIVFKYKLYRNDISLYRAAMQLFKGIFNNDLKSI